MVRWRGCNNSEVEIDSGIFENINVLRVELVTVPCTCLACLILIVKEMS